MAKRTVYTFDSVPECCLECKFLVSDWDEYTYTMSGYDVIRVPIVPIHERVRFVLARL
jgi:predicted ATPase